VRRGAHEPYAALRHAGYRRYLTGNVLFNTGRQALGVAITWQIYQWTNSATALGPVGLVNVIPLIALVQMLTPDRLRGRVTAFNQLFIGSSNEISELRAGLAAALFGPVAAAAGGGLGTIAVTVIVALALPALRTVPPLHTLKSEDEKAAPSGSGR
jgi:hypothetical protein